MGFEVAYHYFEKKQEGNGYDVDNPQQFTKHLGKMEDVPVEKLASTIMMQLARRDIMVFDVEIYEYTKRKVSFKETKGGVLIKNKKFMLDGTVEVVEEEVTEEPAVIQPQVQVQEKPPNRAIRWEVYDPDPMSVPILKKQFQLTPKRKYPIMDEKTVIQRVAVPGGGTTDMPAYEYGTIDDQGRQVRVPSIHFTPEQRGLIGMEHVPVYDEGPQLMHMGGRRNDMPVLRTSY